jgi:hypothetical protein
MIYLATFVSAFCTGWVIAAVITPGLTDGNPRHANRVVRFLSSHCRRDVP